MNIIYILLDQVRKDMIGAYGHQIVKTPNLDRLAKDGIRFNNAFTPASVCGPARTSLFTGLMPSSHGMSRTERIQYLWLGEMACRHQIRTGRLRHSRT